MPKAKKEKKVKRTKEQKVQANRPAKVLKTAHIPHDRCQPKTRELPEQLRDDYVQPTPPTSDENSPEVDSQYTGEVEGDTGPEGGVSDEDAQAEGTVDDGSGEELDATAPPLPPPPPVDDIAAEEEAESTAFAVVELVPAKPELESPMKFGDVSE